MLARLVVEPHREMTSLMVIMLVPACSHTGDRTRLLPPLARLWSRAVSGMISSSGLLELVL